MLSSTNYSMIIAKLADLFTSWIELEKRVGSWTQYKCSRRSACHMRDAPVGISNEGGFNFARG